MRHTNDARAKMREEHANAWKQPLGKPTVDAIAYARGNAAATMLKANRLLQTVGGYAAIDNAHQVRQQKDTAKRVTDGPADVLKHGTSIARSFAPPSKSALTSAANVASAAAVVESKVHALQDILKAESAAIVLIERAQEELASAQATLESVLEKAQSESTDAASVYLKNLARKARGY